MSSDSPKSFDHSSCLDIKTEILNISLDFKTSIFTVSIAKTKSRLSLESARVSLQSGVKWDRFEVWLVFFKGGE